LVTIFADVTTRLPDHTHITRMKISYESLEITGASDNANDLIPLLDKSGNWYAPHFIGGIRKDARTNKDKFTIKAELEEPQTEDQDGSNS